VTGTSHNIYTLRGAPAQQQLPAGPRTREARCGLFSLELEKRWP
jgi:hypothetical protein